jgi:hypothetical protein
MSDLSRREVLRGLALTFVAAGVVDRVSAQEVHQMASIAGAGSSGPYTPTALSVHEYQTVEKLTDFIIPVENGAPGAVAAGVAAFIDLLAGANADLKKIYTDGVVWMDTAMKSRGAADFLSATPEQQTGLLDLIAYRRNQSAELAPGITFFTMARRMTVDGFYTSAIGIRDLDYQGNSPRAAFTVPAASMEYALKKSAQ